MRRTGRATLAGSVTVDRPDRPEAAVVSLEVWRPVRLTVVTATVTVVAAAIVVAVVGPAGRSAAEAPTMPAPTVRLAAPPALVIEVAEPVPEPPPAPEPEPAPIVAARPVEQPAVTMPGECDGEPWALPVGIVWRESRCNYHVVNVDGCGGHSCLGAYQFDARHFSGWANGQAACGDLDWTIPADQHECARRLSRDGTNLAPWGA